MDALTFIGDGTVGPDDPDLLAKAGRRGRRPGAPDEAPRRLAHQTVTVLSPWRVVHAGNAYVGGDTATVPLALAAEWIRNQWVTPTNEPSPTHDTR